MSDPLKHGFTQLSNESTQATWFTSKNSEPKEFHFFDFDRPKTNTKEEPNPPPVTVQSPEEILAKELVEKELGLIQREEELESSQKLLAKAIEETVRYREEIFLHTKSEVLEMCIVIAEAILQEELKTTATIQERLINKAISKLSSTQTQFVRVSELAKEVLDKESVNFPEHVQIQVDPQIEGYGCIIEQGDQRLDARTNEQITTIREVLRTELLEGSQK